MREGDVSREYEWRDCVGQWKTQRRHTHPQHPRHALHRLTLFSPRRPVLLEPDHSRIRARIKQRIDDARQLAEAVCQRDRLPLPVSRLPLPRRRGR